MPRLPRPCLGAVDPATGRPEECGQPVVRASGDRVARCDRHRAMYEAGRRPSPGKRGYDREYRGDRAKVLKVGTGQRAVCSLRLPGCTYWADTADHVVPVSKGGKRGPLRPACNHCNSARGNRGLGTDAPRPAGTVEAQGGEDDWWPKP